MLQFLVSAKQSNPLAMKCIPHIAFIIADLSNSTRRIGLGVGRPIVRVSPKQMNPDPSNLRHWSRPNTSPSWMSAPEMVEKMYNYFVVEPIAANPGPTLIGLSNMQRWNLSIHPMDGLIPVSA